MVIKQFGRTDIVEQRLDLLVPLHFLHLADGRPGTRRLGEKARAQRISAHSSGSSPTNLAYFWINRAIEQSDMCFCVSHPCGSI